MTTQLTRPVRRAVVTGAGTKLIVTLTATGMELRYPYARKALLLPYGAALRYAAEIAHAAKQREKAAKRKTKKVHRSLLRR